jgi:nitronate monooxygenase
MMAVSTNRRSSRHSIYRQRESGAHPVYKQAVVEASAGPTEITDVFAVCPLCATMRRARVLRSCIDAVRQLGEDRLVRR